MLALCAALAVGCATDGGADAEAALVLEANALAAALSARGPEAVAADELRVRLAFGADADLDLYVTDPLQETVYFANNPTRAGGELDADARCGPDGLRVETVRFRAPLPGRYRVGVDFPERCGGGEGPVAFLVVVEHGDVRREQHGAIEWHVFEPIVLETDVPAGD